MKHAIDSRMISKKEMLDLFADAEKIRTKKSSPLKGKILASLFYEPSTRTRLSFESAMYRLGGSVISTENARESSSIVKGESIEDTIRVIAHYADVVVMRHFEEGSADRAARVSAIPIINAGDGVGQHPTQALLDLYTIWRERGSIDNLSLAIIGDLKNGRTVKSLLWALSQFKDIHATLVSPKALRLPTAILDELAETSLVLKETDRLDSILPLADIVYQTRIQKERFPTIKEYEKYKSCYKIDEKLARTMKKGALLLHPLPRVDEIAPEVDRLPQAAYFRQAENGLYLRSALLKHLLL